MATRLVETNPAWQDQARFLQDRTPERGQQRTDVSCEVQETHCDQCSQKEEMEERRQYLYQFEGREGHMGSFSYRFSSIHSQTASKSLAPA